MLVGTKIWCSQLKVVMKNFRWYRIELLCLTDGKSYKFYQPKDYKRIGEGDTGLNTGGMGAVSPVPYVDAILMEKIETRIVKPTIEGFQKDEFHIKVLFSLG
jgi:phosphoribosylamine--glycine ligase